ncbi:LysR family transcriptional regulator [Pedobacter sp. BS3]|uniref:hydrogen peroxide-inducible genes activator n=1 Tax=Pedobacter sp. BS3 TaxID=2567937 RepID=UPI0011EFA155|nr:hydrogen peroxide-inducible genes activator [Pedobacter sp. BS3]TZF80899.1 LysR family transcriptional regulator [Pedobacter sp. BS3]
MTLIQLEYIVAVDTYRSFVTAAEKCFVTQPTLSMQVQKLEDMLGVKLFDRSKQPVVPTEIGVEIISQARRILNESAKIKEIIAEHKGEIKGVLKVGVIPTIAPYLLPKIILNFIKKYPELQLQIWEYTTEEIVHQLKIGLLDCGILATPIGDASINEIPLFYETFVAYVSESSSLMKKKAITGKDINLNEIWLLNEGHCMRNQVINICRQQQSAEQPRKFEYNTGSVETLKRMVDLNNGITILPELSLSDLSDKQLKRVRHFKAPEPVREISIITHRNFLKRTAIQALEQEIMGIVPKHMRQAKKKEVMEIYA